MIVLDASAALDLLLRRQPDDRLLDLVVGPGASVHAPDLIDAEVLHVLRRYVRGGEVTHAMAGEIRRDFEDLPIHCYPSRSLLDRAWELRENVTVYDALYVALAEALGATLVTADPALACACACATTSSIPVETVG